MQRWQRPNHYVDPDQQELFPLAPPRSPAPVPGKRANSRAAAASVTRAKATSQRNRILFFVASRGERGATRDEIAATLGMDIQTVTPRVLELINPPLQQLRESGTTRPTRKGRAAAVLVAK